MNALLNGLTVAVEQDSTRLGVLGCKLTLLLAAAWAIHFALRNANPRWRVLLWRSTCCGVVLLLVTSLSPGMVNLAILPAEMSSVVSEKTDLSPTHAATAPDNPPAKTSIPVTQPASVADVTPTVSKSTTSSTQPTPVPGPSVASAAGLDRQLPSATQSASPITQAEALSTAPAAPPVTVAATTPNDEPVVQRSGWTLMQWISVVWLCGAGLAALRLFVGFRQIARVCRAAALVPESVRSAAVGIAQSLQLNRRFEIRQTDAVQSPCIVGIFRPLILLPQRQCEPEHQDELPAILAHELAHLQGLDVLWNTAFSCLSIGLWFHPFLWRVRLAHADACDAVSDTAAARYLGDAQQYGRTLARLALRTAERELTIGLAMARGSSLKRRLETVQQNLLRATVSRATAFCVVLPSLTIVILCGLLTLTHSAAAPPTAAKSSPAEKSVDPGQKGRTAQTINTKSVMAVKVADVLGVPLKGVKVSFRGKIDRANVNRVLDTDEEGMVFFEHPGPASISYLRMETSFPGHVPQHYSWESAETPAQLQSVIELKLQTGTLVSGTVEDEAGKPVAGAAVQISMPITWPERRSYSFTTANLKTDDKGRWKWDAAPAESTRLSVGVKHPDYLGTYEYTRKGTGIVTVLKQGLQVSGFVVDGKGQPVDGAHVLLGTDRFGSDDPEARTGEDGRFVLKNCKKGKSLVTVKAEGFSPGMLPVNVGEESKPLEFRLEPGHLVHLRIVDSQGQPISGAYLFTDTWAGARTLDTRLKSDLKGEMVWKSAPAEAVLCVIGHEGYMTRRDHPVKASDKMQTVTLPPQLVISGTVTDGKTGKPIPQFRIRNGQRYANSSQIYWSDETFPFSNGQYRLKFTEPAEARLLQISLDGYDAVTSRRFASDEGSQTFDFALQPGVAGPTGIVLLPDGRPAEGVKVVLATRDRTTTLHNGELQQTTADAVTTDSGGHFAFPKPDANDYLLLAVHDQGIANLMKRESTGTATLKLKAWGQLKGKVRRGSKPDANCEVNFQVRSPDDRSLESFVRLEYRAKTDAAGEFEIDRVIPGPGVATRVLITRMERGFQHAPAWQTRVEILPGKQTQVTVGGTGRPVIGRVVLNRKPDVEIDWTTNDPASIMSTAPDTTITGFRRFLGSIRKSGEFTIPDVPPGKHRLTIGVDSPAAPGSWKTGQTIGFANVDFTMPDVPGGYSDEPLDLGTVTAVLNDTLDPGEFAPEFVAEQIPGGVLRLADHRGKLILLNFWATWYQQSVADFPALRKVHARFAKDPRFLQVGLVCDTERNVVEKTMKSQELTWPQLLVGSTHGRIAKQYTVTTLPQTFLIGPNGKVLARNLKEVDLERTIASALANPKLFETAGEPRPPRYPVNRFPKNSAAARMTEAPAVAVLDDTDPEYDGPGPHQDHLRVLSASGRELWSATGFNCCQTSGPQHAVVVDRRRNRLYVSEVVGNRVTAFSTSGQKLWQVEQIPVHVLSVDEKTGNLWCCTSGHQDAETAVFSPEGEFVNSWPYGGLDMAYDPHTDAFWLVGTEILKLSREGKILFRQSVSSPGYWRCAIAVNPADGSVWIPEQEVTSIPETRNRLWVLNADGTVRRQISLADRNPWGVAFDPTSKAAWVSSYKEGLQRVTAQGTPEKPLPFSARGVSVSPTTGDLWISNEEGVLRIDATGKVLARSPFRAKSQQSWLIAF